VPTSPFDLTSSLLLGDGAIDATAVLTEAFFDEPLTINDISNVEGVGAVELSFTKTLDDLDEAFVYWVECQGLLEPLDPDLEEIPTPNAAYILPSDSGQALGGIAGFTPAIKSVDKAPLVRDAAPGSEVVCSITPRASAELWTPSILTMTALVPIDASPATLTMSEKALGIDLLVTDDSEYPAGTQVTHTASCKDDAGTEVWSGELIEGVPQSIPSNPRAQLTCISTSSVKYKTATAIEKQSEPAKASATDVSAPTVTLTPDMGGVLVSWVVDVNLASAISQSLSLVCTQAGTEFFNKEMEAGATEYFVEASDDAPVECIISSTMSADGLTTVTIEGSGDATPEPMSSGLPIWLLYQAAQ